LLHVRLSRVIKILLTYLLTYDYMFVFISIQLRATMFNKFQWS